MGGWRLEARGTATATFWEGDRYRVCDTLEGWRQFRDLLLREFPIEYVDRHCRELARLTEFISSRPAIFPAPAGRSAVDVAIEFMARELSGADDKARIVEASRDVRDKRDRRERIATAALQATVHQGEGHYEKWADWACDAVDLADALIARLDEGQS